MPSPGGSAVQVTRHGGFAAFESSDGRFCIPSKSNRKTAIPYDAVLYKQRHKIENMFARLKDWRRIHTRYRPLRPHLPVGNLHSRNRRLLAVINESLTLVQHKIGYQE